MESKAVKVSRRKYDADFKKEVVEMIASGRPVSEVAQALGIGTKLIYKWSKQVRQNAMSRTGEAEVLFDADKALLHKRIKELELERDSFKKALGIFSGLL